MDEDRIAAELIALAETHEAKARQLRQAAAIVRGDDAPRPTITDSAPDTPATVEQPEHGRSNQPLPTASADEYMAVIQSAAPATNWDAATLKQAMNEAGYGVNLEAARTMLYRLQSRGRLIKRGRGTWALRDAVDTDSSTRTDPASAGSVQVLHSTAWGGDRNASVG